MQIHPSTDLTGTAPPCEAHGKAPASREDALSKITAKLAQLSDLEAIKAYATLRAAVMGAHTRGKPADRATVQAMVLTGNALEARIGSKAFDQLMDQIDATTA